MTVQLSCHWLLVFHAWHQDFHTRESASSFKHTTGCWVILNMLNIYETRDFTLSRSELHQTLPMKGKSGKIWNLKDVMKHWLDGECVSDVWEALMSFATAMCFSSSYWFCMSSAHSRGQSVWQLLLSITASQFVNGLGVGERERERDVWSVHRWSWMIQHCLSCAKAQS